MCERTKTEVLARELCIEFWAGHQNKTDTVSDNFQEFVEAKHSQWEKRAERILKTLERHKE